MNDEGRLEWELRKKKPVKFDVDPTEHPETQDSIGWSEKYYHQGLGDPRIENVTETWQFIPPNH